MPEALVRNSKCKHSSRSQWAQVLKDLMQRASPSPVAAQAVAGRGQWPVPCAGTEYQPAASSSPSSSDGIPDGFMGEVDQPQHDDRSSSDDSDLLAQQAKVHPKGVILTSSARTRFVFRCSDRPRPVILGAISGHMLIGSYQCSDRPRPVILGAISGQMLIGCQSWSPLPTHQLLRRQNPHCPPFATPRSRVLCFTHDSRLGM